VTHNVINRDSQYHLSIILSINETSFEELRIIFKYDKIVVLPLAFIFELNLNEKDFKLHKSYYSDDSVVSLLFNKKTTKESYFMQY
jgi:hypothetical protein